MPPLNECEVQKKLAAEGFAHIFVWQDAPNTYYPDHEHAGLTAHVILDGDMTLTLNGQPKKFRAGDRCDVPAGAPHSARMGRDGCRYLVGEKLEATT